MSLKRELKGRCEKCNPAPSNPVAKAYLGRILVIALMTGWAHTAGKPADVCVLAAIIQNSFTLLMHAGCTAAIYSQAPAPAAIKSVLMIRRKAFKPAMKFPTLAVAILLMAAAGSASPASSIKSLWGPAGTFAETPAASLGIKDNMLQQLYSPQALKRAKTWIQNKKMLWCGTAATPDIEPQDGVFPFEAAPTNSTRWPGACPTSARAQELFDKGLAWRMLFNDNEATCAFRAAGRIAKDCAMAHLGAALSMGPNVNYAFIISPYIYSMILKSLDAARTAISTNSAAQLPLAPVIFAALSQRYCVDGTGQLDAALKMSPEAAFAAYNQRFKGCGAAFTTSVTQLAQQFPEDPNIAAIAAGALMEQPAWKWWAIGSQTAGALVDVAVTVPAANSQTPNSTSSVKVSEKQPISLTGQLIEPHAAMANTILNRGLGTSPDHLGLLHYMIHNMEQGPEPNWAQAVADRLFNLGGASQGHAAHMRTHIDMRVGDYGRVINGNKRAIFDDAQWNLARSGGGIMSILYKYNPHNIAFIAEAAQHAGRWRDMAGAIAMLGYGAGFPLVADPSMASLVSYHTRQVLQPLRFGMYQALVDGTNPGGNCPLQGTGENTTLTVNLPGKQTFKVPCGQTCSDAKLFARTVALARLGRDREAQAELSRMVLQACKDRAVAVAGLGVCKITSDLNAKATTSAGRRLQAGGAPAGSSLMAAGDVTNVITGAEKIAAVYSAASTASRSETLSLTSNKASGTLTINNGDLLSALNLLVPAAEVAGAAGQRDVQLRLLRQAVQLQSQLQYDEPAPFFYPIGETLAGVLLKQGSQQDLQEAAYVLREVLFQWPRSALAAIALGEVLQRGGKAAEAAATQELVVMGATRLNDTALDLSWL